MRTVAERNALVLQYQRLAYKLAAELYRTSSQVRRLGELDDVVSVAQLGLLRAAERYDEADASAASFLTYATSQIRARILSEAADAGPIRLPNYVVWGLRNGQLETEARSDPLAARRLRQARAAYCCGRIRDALDRPRAAEEEPFCEPGLVREAVARLPPREQDIVSRYYGLDGQLPQTLRAVGRSLGLSPERVRQILADVRQRLRERLEPALG